MRERKVGSDILRYIDMHLEDKLSAAEIAAAAGYSSFYFSRIFKEEMNMTINEYVIRRKLIKASEELTAGRKVIDVAFKYGWKSHAGFTKAFKKEFGFSPSLLKVMIIEIQRIGECGMEPIFLESTEPRRSKEELFEGLIRRMKENGIKVNEKEAEKMYQYADTAYKGRKRYSGEEYVTHPISVAILLADLGADRDTIYAGLFCDVLKKGKTTLEQLKEVLSETIIGFIMEMNQFDCREVKDCSEEVILVKLAERLHNMRTVQFMDKAEWKKKAEETIELFLPMARRLENQKLINELNDLCLRYLS